MASISNPNLAIQINLPGSTVKTDVTCRVNFSAFELFNMQHGVRYKVTCKIMGDDPLFDNALFTFPTSKIFPDGTPSRVETVKFSATMPARTLDEDNSFFDDSDEVYAVITLTNLETGGKVVAQTRNMVHHF